METHGILWRIYAAGVTLSPTDRETIPFAGKALPAELASLLRSHNPAILAELERQGIGRDDDNPGGTPKKYATPPACGYPRVCGRVGWCQVPEMVKECGWRGQLSEERENAA